jgi:hypothetical protein
MSQSIQHELAELPLFRFAIQTERDLEDALDPFLARTPRTAPMSEMSALLGVIRPSRCRDRACWARDVSGVKHFPELARGHAHVPRKDGCEVTVSKSDGISNLTDG